MPQENKFAFGVLQIAAANKQGIATFPACKALLPRLVKIDPAELSPSVTRPGEPMWHQFIRNIKSHSASDWNYIYLGYLVHIPRVGYRITDQGRKYLKSKGAS